MSDNKTFDLIVIGAGIGGYVAAIRASQLGMKVAVVEKSKTLGGTCLNIGCIPSKAMLESSEQYHHVSEEIKTHGIEIEGIKLNLDQMLKRKLGVVKQLTQGIEFLFKKNKIEWIKGTAKITQATGDSKQIDVAGKIYSAKKLVIATGSLPIELPFMKFDGDAIVDSEGALSFSRVPEHLVIVGGGYIGLEMGSVWLRLGSKVTVVEFSDRIIPAMDKQVADVLFKTLKKAGMEFKLGTKCSGAEKKGKYLMVNVEDAQSGEKGTLECDKVMVAVGRRPFFGDLGIEDAGIKINDRGQIDVNDHLETSVPGLFAIGDCVRGPMLAHKSEEEGVAVAEHIAGQAAHVNYDAIPGVVYTWPELAAVGKTEQELKDAGIEYRVGTFPFLANGRAKAMQATDGMVKILADKKTDKLLGVHIVGPRAGDLIAEAVAVMEFGGSAEDIARTSHAHPTLSEVVKEAALAVDKRALHI